MARITKETKEKIVVEVVRSKYQGKLDKLKKHFSEESEKAARAFYARELSVWDKAVNEGIEDFLNARKAFWVSSKCSCYNLFCSLFISAYKSSTERLHGILNGYANVNTIEVSFSIPYNQNLNLRDVDDGFFTEELLTIMKDIQALYAEATEAVKTLTETLNAFTTVKKLLESFPELGTYFPNDSDTNVLVSMETLSKAKNLLLSVQDVKENTNG